MVVEKMNFEQIGDLIVVVMSAVAVIIFYVYSKNKIAIDKKAMQGDRLAKAEKMIANSASAIVYQTEKDGGSGQEKLVSALNYLTAILDMAHLPHPSTAYIKGEIEKSVTTMKQTKNAVESMQTVTGQYKPFEKTETKKEKKKNA